MSSAQPLPGLKILPPITPPRSDEHLLGYSSFEPEAGCCKCDTLTSGGITAVILLTLLFPAAACIPCCMKDCHQPFQRPNYGKETAASQGYPVDGHKSGTDNGYAQSGATTQGSTTGYSQPGNNAQGYTQGGSAGYPQGQTQSGSAGYPNVHGREATSNQGYVEMGGKEL